MSLEGGKKRVKRSGEREMVNNVQKLMKTESEVGITIPLSKPQRRVKEATRVSRRTSCRILKEYEKCGNWCRNGIFKSAQTQTGSLQ